MNRILFFIIIIFPQITCAQNQVRFFSESIDFSIDSAHFSVNGLYHFSNRTDQNLKQTILFPFPENEETSVNRVDNLTYNTQIPYHQTENGITFKLHLLPFDTIILNISYSQKVSTKNTYILESSQAWNEPLENASYSLKYNSSIVIDSLSISPDSEQDNIYYWNKTDFYPSENFEVWIKYNSAPNRVDG